MPLCANTRSRNSWNMRALESDNFYVTTKARLSPCIHNFG
ncbi:hypothetical protein D918_01486 [Trichuris suis]|nr:hypothetical protein D918_01486 [Trichuris suis]